VYGDDQFASVSVLFQIAMALDTHKSVKPNSVLCSPNSLSKHFPIRFKLGFRSGIRELTDAHLYGSLQYIREIQTYREQKLERRSSSGWVFFMGKFFHRVLTIHFNSDLDSFASACDSTVLSLLNVR